MYKVHLHDYDADCVTEEVLRTKKELQRFMKCLAIDRMECREGGNEGLIKAIDDKDPFKIAEILSDLSVDGDGDWVEIREDEDRLYDDWTDEQIKSKMAVLRQEIKNLTRQR
tara:strand:+ start:77 stop:412 length:336 start_codon:yes stop_codon:yes gene_type:complete